MWGYKRFFRRTMLDTSDYLKDDCLKINCKVGVVVSMVDTSTLHQIEVPDSDIGAQFGMLLEDEESSDVTFDVCGENVCAHRLVLAARSPAFEAEFSSRTMEGSHQIVITDMVPKVFKAFLHFIYRDSLTEDEDLLVSSSMSSVNDTLPAQLLAAADKYGLSRLKVICESLLCRGISVNSVAEIQALADQYHAMDLKAVCLKFSEDLEGEPEVLEGPGTKDGF